MDRGSIREGIAPDLIQFICGEVAPLADGQALQPQRPHLHTAQLLHGVTQRQQHATDLAVAALEELHVQDRLLTVTRNHVQATGLRLAAGASLTITQKDTALESCEILIRQLPRHRHLVALVHLVPRMRQSIGQLAVVGHEQQAR